jgi:DNA replication protein DnaC
VSYKNIELTEEEKNQALRAALEMKIAKVKEAEYWERVKNPPKPKMLTSAELIQVVIKRGETSIPGFELTEADVKIYTLLAEYFTNDPKFEQEGKFSLRKGLLIYGNIGCGKTSALNLFRTIVNPSFPIIACREVSNQLKTEGFQIIDKYSNYPCVCFDDLGTESISKNFGNESNVMSELILARYDKFIQYQFKTHMTTNMSAEMIKANYGEREASRMREMFNLIKFPSDAKDKRK